MAWERGPRVAVCIPHQQATSIEWALAFRLLQLPPDTVILLRSGGTVDLARNLLVKDALSHGVEWIFWLDADVIPPPDALYRLLRHNLPIVSGLYWKRYPHGGGFAPAMWRLAPPERRGPRQLYEPVAGFRPGELVEVDAVGMGCCLTHASIFERLRPPWFKFTAYWSEVDPGVRVEEEVSEDFYFCRRVREELGLRIYVDTSVACRHEYVGVVDERGRVDYYRT